MFSFAAVLSLSTAHFNLKSPTPYNPFQCQLLACKGPCPPIKSVGWTRARNSPSNPSAVWSRGEEVTIEWHRNSHNGGTSSHPSSWFALCSSSSLVLPYALERRALQTLLATNKEKQFFEGMLTSVAAASCTNFEYIPCRNAVLSAKRQRVFCEPRDSDSSIAAQSMPKDKNKTCA